MSKISRRTLFPLAGLAPFGLTNAGEVPIPEQFLGGIRVVLTHRNGGWHVCVPDMEYMDHPQWGYRLGMIIPWKWIKLDEYLKQVEEVCEIR